MKTVTFTIEPFTETLNRFKETFKAVQAGRHEGVHEVVAGRHGDEHVAHGAAGGGFVAGRSERASRLRGWRGLIHWWGLAFPGRRVTRPPPTSPGRWKRFGRARCVPESPIGFGRPPLSCPVREAGGHAAAQFRGWAAMAPLVEPSWPCVGRRAPSASS